MTEWTKSDSTVIFVERHGVDSCYRSPLRVKNHIGGERIILSIDICDTVAGRRKCSIQ